jgi:hypothetical protein
MRARIATLLLLGLLTAVPAADAAKRKPVSGPGLWASVNKCDTSAAPDTIGLRGSMPGLGKRRTVAAMRFRVQFRRPSDGRWADAGADATSTWKTLGPVTDAVLESGQDFRFQPPAGGGKHVLRGVIQYRWSRKGKVVRRAVRITEAGHPSSAGGDPAGYSAGTCTIR